MYSFTACVFLFVGGVVADVCDAHPEVLLHVKSPRRPGETYVQYSQRELARLDAIMQRLFAKGAKVDARAEKTLQKCDETIQRVLVAHGKQKEQADALRALGGGIADHPKFSAIDHRTPEQKAADDARIEAREKRIAAFEADLMKEAAKDPVRYQPILEQYRADIEKARELEATLKKK